VPETRIRPQRTATDKLAVFGEQGAAEKAEDRVIEPEHGKSSYAAKMNAQDNPLDN